MIAIWKEKGLFDKEAYTAEKFDCMEDLRISAKSYRGVLICVAVYGNISEEKALKYYFDEIKAR